MIAVPIGNLGDITERAMRTIEVCDELWCEDTRHTQALLNALGMESKRVRRVDQHITESDLNHLLERVDEQGQHIGVVTDAGTPGLSDPGSKIIERMTRFSRIRIEPIPGASSLTCFISIAGFSENTFVFQGFFPRSTGDAEELLSEIKGSTSARSFVFFESPNRIRDTIECLKVWCEEPEFTPKFILAKELTKLHETIWMGDGAEFLDHLLQQQFDERGEWVFGIELSADWLSKNDVKNRKADTDWVLSLDCLISAGISTKQASHVIAEKYKIAKNLAYREALELQKKIKNSESKA